MFNILRISKNFLLDIDDHDVFGDNIKYVKRVAFLVLKITSIMHVQA